MMSFASRIYFRLRKQQRRDCERIVSFNGRKKKLNHTMELIFLTFLLIFKLNYLGKILLSNINIIDHQESFVLFRFCDWKSKNMENRVLE